MSRDYLTDSLLLGVMNGPLKFLTARKILPLLDLLAKFKRVLACSCSQKNRRARHARECSQRPFVTSTFYCPSRKLKSQYTWRFWVSKSPGCKSVPYSIHTWWDISISCPPNCDICGGVGDKNDSRPVRGLVLVHLCS